MRIYGTNGIRKRKNEKHHMNMTTRKKQNIITHAQHADQFLLKNKNPTTIEKINQHAKPNGKRNMAN